MGVIVIDGEEEDVRREMPCVGADRASCDFIPPVSLHLDVQIFDCDGGALVLRSAVRDTCIQLHPKSYTTTI